MIDQQRLFMFCRGGLRYWICFMLLFAVIATPVLAAEQTDGSYTMNYVIKKAEDDSASMANDYFEKPAAIQIKDGKTTVEITLNHSEWITEFKVPKGGSYGDVAVISKDTTADKRVVSFQVSTLTEPLLAKIHVTVPSIDYDHDYTIRFVFDQESMKLVKAATSEISTEKVESEKPVSKPSDTSTKPTDTSGNKEVSTSKEQNKAQIDTTTMEKKHAVTVPKTTTSSSKKVDSGKTTTSEATSNNEQKISTESNTKVLDSDEPKNTSSTEEAEKFIEEQAASSGESSMTSNTEQSATDLTDNKDHTGASLDKESKLVKAGDEAEVSVNAETNDPVEEAAVAPVIAQTSIKESSSGIWWFIIAASVLGAVAVFEIRRRKGKTHTKK